jgi:hypothetical protein
VTQSPSYPKSAASIDGSYDLAWWQLLWGLGANRTQADAPPLFPAPTAADKVAGDAPRAAGLPSNPTQGYTPAAGVVPAYARKTYQGVSPNVAPGDPAQARSPQVRQYVDVSYADWKGQPYAPPTPVPYYVIDRVQIPPHPVFTRTPTAVVASKTLIYQ